jgi:hypothetical protein
MTDIAKEVTIEEAAAEVDRELQVRMRIYDRWIADGKLTRVDARDRLARLKKALAELNKLLDLQQASEEMKFARAS